LALKIVNSSKFKDGNEKAKTLHDEIQQKQSIVNRLGEEMIDFFKEKPAEFWLSVMERIGYDSFAELNDDYKTSWSEEDFSIFQKKIHRMKPEYKEYCFEIADTLQNYFVKYLEKIALNLKIPVKEIYEMCDLNLIQ